MLGKLKLSFAKRLGFAVALVAALGGQVAMPAYADDASADGVEINLHDYEREKTTKWENTIGQRGGYRYSNQGGINSSAETLKFGTIAYEDREWISGDNYKDAVQTKFDGPYNVWPGAKSEGQKDGVTQDIVKKSLNAAGYPQLAVGGEESLAYLFGGASHSYVKNYAGVTGLLTKDGEGYYSFDSAV